MVSASPGARLNDPPGERHRPLRGGLPGAVSAPTPVRALSSPGGDETVPHQGQPDDAGQMHGMCASETGAAFLRPSPLPALPAPREPAMAGTATEEAGPRL